MNIDPDGRAAMCSTNTNAAIGAVIGGVGGAFVGAYIGGMVAGVYGNWTGNGACGPSRSGRDRNDQLILTWILGNSSTVESQNRLAILAALIFYDKNIGSIAKPVSDLDEASMDHDRDGPSPFENKSKAGNSKWIERAWSMPGWQKTNGLRFLVEAPIRVLGTVGFGLANAAIGASTIRKERYVMRHDRYKSKWQL